LARESTGTSVGNRFTSSPDFAALATSLGCTGVRAEDAGALARALAEARERDGTTLIHCPTVDGEVPASGAFWDLGVPEVAHDPATRRLLARAHDRRRAARQRRVT
jgi:TPP-dependent trihydroxycyclohexane-1,2-dione (THcHDO) dehydratase